MTPVPGLRELLHATFAVVPEAVQDALVAAQKVDLTMKLKSARVAVAAGTTAAAGAAAVSIPLSDSALILPFQIAMMARIAVIFGLPVSAPQLGSLATSAFFACGCQLGCHTHRRNARSAKRMA